MNVLVVGATGFVGGHLCPQLIKNGFGVTAVVRSAGTAAALQEVVIEDLAQHPSWDGVFDNIDAIVHLAARVHVMQDSVGDPLLEYRRMNTDVTKRLATAAAAAGVKRFVYISTIKVLGERTDERPFKHDDLPAPCDPYAVSKFEAEQVLERIALETGMDVVVLRPPLIYGPHVGGNVLRAFGLVAKGYPLPLGMIRNKRSMLGVSNLCDVITRALADSNTPGQPLLVADGEDLSTRQFFESVGRSMQKSVWMLPVPEVLLRLGGTLLRRSDAIDRLIESLQIDISKTVELLGWTPIVSVEEEMSRTAQWFLQSSERR